MHRTHSPLCVRQRFCCSFAAVQDAETLLSIGDDKLVKCWTLDAMASPSNTYISKHVLTDVDHSWTAPTFVTGGEVVQVWDYVR